MGGRLNAWHSAMTLARKGDPAIAHLLAIDPLLIRRSALTVEMRNVPFAEQKAICTDILKAAPHLVGAAIERELAWCMKPCRGISAGSSDCRESDDGAGLGTLFGCIRFFPGLVLTRTCRP